jgi:hypothetical protein
VQRSGLRSRLCYRDDLEGRGLVRMFRGRGGEVGVWCYYNIMYGRVF